MLVLQRLELARQALPYAAVIASFYALVLLFWSPQWPAVYAVALAIETLAVVAEDWSGDYTGFRVFVTHSLPAFIVAVTQVKGLTGASIAVWLVRAAVHMHASIGASRGAPAELKGLFVSI